MGLGWLGAERAFLMGLLPSPAIGITPFCVETTFLWTRKRKTMPSIEVLASVLKELVGRGVTPARLAVCPELKQLAGVTGQPRKTQQLAGYMVREYMQKGAESMPGGMLEGRWYPPEKLREAITILLELDGRNELAEVRRFDAIDKLEVFCTIDRWRKVPGPEMELMLLFARHLIDSRKPVAS